MNKTQLLSWIITMVAASFITSLISAFIPLGYLSFIVWMIIFYFLSNAITKFIYQIGRLYGKDERNNRNNLENRRFAPTNDPTNPWVCLSCFKWIKEPRTHICEAAA